MIAIKTCMEAVLLTFCFFLQFGEEGRDSIIDILENAQLRYALLDLDEDQSDEDEDEEDEEDDEETDGGSEGDSENYDENESNYEEGEYNENTGDLSSHRVCVAKYSDSLRMMG